MSVFRSRVRIGYGSAHIRISQKASCSSLSPTSALVADPRSVRSCVIHAGDCDLGDEA